MSCPSPSPPPSAPGAYGYWLTDHVCELRVFLQELDHTVSKLCLVLDQGLGLVEWGEDLGQELTMLRLQGQGKPVDDAPEDFQQLCHSIELLCLVDESVCRNRESIILALSPSPSPSLSPSSSPSSPSP